MVYLIVVSLIQPNVDIRTIARCKVYREGILSEQSSRKQEAGSRKQKASGCIVLHPNSIAVLTVSNHSYAVHNYYLLQMLHEHTSPRPQT